MERASNPAECRTFLHASDEPDSDHFPSWPTGLAVGLANVRYAVIRPRFAPGCSVVPPLRRLVTPRIRRRQCTSRFRAGCPRLRRLISCSRRPLVCHHLYLQMPRPTSFGKDTGLQVRMTVTLFLL